MDQSSAQRAAREEQDRADFKLILETYQFRGYAKWVREIHMRPLHKGVLMNLKIIVN